MRSVTFFTNLYNLFFFGIDRSSPSMRPVHLSTFDVACYGSTHNKHQDGTFLMPRKMYPTFDILACVLWHCFVQQSLRDYIQLPVSLRQTERPTLFPRFKAHWKLKLEPLPTLVVFKMVLLWYFRYFQHKGSVSQIPAIRLATPRRPFITMNALPLLTRRVL